MLSAKPFHSTVTLLRHICLDKLACTCGQGCLLRRWAAIIATTVAIRCLIFPVQLWAMKNTRKLSVRAERSEQCSASAFRLP